MAMNDPFLGDQIDARHPISETRLGPASPGIAPGNETVNQSRHKFSTRKTHLSSARQTGNGLTDDSMDKIRHILMPLRRGDKARLFDLINQGGLWDEHVELQIARLLVEQLNGARNEHARRLWTSWFDPILLRDDLTLQAHKRLPGSLHIAEAGSWWYAMSGFLAPLAGTIEKTIATQSRDRPLDHIFASPEARVWAGELRQQTLKVITSLRAKASSCNRLVAYANAHRIRLVQDRGLTCSTVLTPADIDTLETMLTAAPVWKRLDRPATVASPGDLARFAAAMVGRKACSPEGAVLLALALMHARRDPTIALMLHRSLRQPVLWSAVITHFQFAAQRLRRCLEERYLSQHHLLEPVVDDADAGTLLSQLFAWYDTAHALEADCDTRALGIVASILGSVVKLIDRDLVPAVSHQVLSLTPRSSPLSAIEQLEFIGQFQFALRRRGLALMSNPRLPALGSHVAGLFRAIARIGASHADPGACLTALARLARLGELVDAPIEANSTNVPLVAVVGKALSLPNSLDPLEQKLADRVVGSSRWELRQPNEARL